MIIKLIVFYILFIYIVYLTCDVLIWLFASQEWAFYTCFVFSRVIHSIVLLGIVFYV
jgi:hypothetical protein